MFKEKFDQEQILKKIAEAKLARRQAFLNSLPKKTVPTAFKTIAAEVAELKEKLQKQSSIIAEFKKK